MTDTHRLVYEGPAPFVSMLVQFLEDEGVVVEWERPQESRGAGEVLENVVSDLITAGTLLAVKVAVDRFRSRVRGRAKVQIDDEPDDGGFF